MTQRKLIIIGSGPAAYTAAIYAARANLTPLLFEGFTSGPVGGQLMTTSEIENYPGFSEGILGPKLMGEMQKQALHCGTEIITEDVEEVDLSKHPFLVTATSHSEMTLSLIIATGANAKRLDIPGTRDGEFWQKGVTACAVCDGASPIFRNRPLFVIGGGDTAVEEALFLTKFASKVWIVHRRSELRASKIMANRALHHPKIEVLWNRTLERVEGDRFVGKVILRNVETNQSEEHEAGGVFFAIGHQPNTPFLKGQLKLDENQYIITKKGSTRTSIAGVFAAGDVQDHLYRQAITAAGTGCMAALDVERWLTRKGLIE